MIERKIKRERYIYKTKDIDKRRDREMDRQKI